LDMADLMEIASFKRPAGAADIRAVLGSGRTGALSSKDGNEAVPGRLDTESTCSGGTSASRTTAPMLSEDDQTEAHVLENQRKADGNAAAAEHDVGPLAGQIESGEPSGNEDSAMEDDAQDKKD